MTATTAKPLTPNDLGPDTRDDFEVLKDERLFAVFSNTGCMNGIGTGPSELHCKDGLFDNDTRVLSRFILSLNRTSVIPMSRSVSDDAAIFHASLANSRLIDSAGRELPPYALHIQRERFLTSALFDRLVITNFSGGDVDLDLSLDIWADFRDIFEVRGVERDARGRLGSPLFENRWIRFRYTTRDDRRIGTEISFDRAPVNVSGRAHFRIRLAPGETDEIDVTARPISGEELDADLGAFDPDGDGLKQAMKDRREEMRGKSLSELGARRSRLDLVTTNRPRFDSWLGRSSADLALLTTHLDTGHYPFAGLPWFAAPFGRDAIITALQTVWLDPSLARGVLGYLAATQATETDGCSEAQPGKILHEARQGEMASLGEVPFGRYYGGVDQTLLFVMLAWETYSRTGDRELLADLEPNVAAALDWARDFGDCDGDDFVEYTPSTTGGLRNQGWKDSNDAVFHTDGSLAEGPIALVEVQAYHVAALRAAARIYDVLDRPDESGNCHERADALTDKLDAAFWNERLGAWVMALDGDKRPVEVMTSNAGHVLYAEAAAPQRVDRFLKRMDGPDILTHWGYRTVARGASRFNPMGYHTGSIWPHDNSLIAAGFARYGDKRRAGRVTTALFHAADQFHNQRLPELYCGFDTEASPALVSYPSACSPQAWAAGSALLCLQACLGLQIDVPQSRVHIVDPQLPAGLDHLEIRRLGVAGRRADLRFKRGADGRTHLEVLKASTRLNFTFDIRPDPAGDHA